MATKNFDARVRLKHDIEANWVKAVNFIPLESELIVYDPSSDDPTYPVDYYRFKIGDGVTLINNLDFVDFAPEKAAAIDNIEEQISQLSSEKVDKTDETYKAEIVQYVLDSIGCPVFGVVDENNNIILTGTLADGTYSVKYEMDDETTVDIGTLELDSNVYYSVSNNLTNCTNNNADTSIVEGGSYSATISANDGYELSSVVVTMGGTDITSSSVSGDTISIASVTGNIVITAIAEETTVEITNWIEQVGYITDTRLSISSGGTTAASGYECTGFIPAKYGDELYIENVDLTEENATNIIFYDSEKNQMVVNTSGRYGTQLYYVFVTNGTQTGDGYSATLMRAGALDALPETFEFIRIGSKSITAESVLHIKRDGVWL